MATTIERAGRDVESAMSAFVDARNRRTRRLLLRSSESFGRRCFTSGVRLWPCFSCDTLPVRDP